MANTVLIPREQVVYIAEETAAGNLTAPTSASATAIVGMTVLNQNPTYSESEEIANSRSILAYTRDLIPAGTWQLSTYLRPSGAAGTPPAEAPLLTALFGTETTSTAAGTVTYSPAMSLPTLSIWWKGQDNSVLFVRGATVNQATLNAGATGYPMLEFSGSHMRLGWCGESALTGAESAGSTTIVVDDVNHFAPGARIEIVDSTAIYTISSVTTGTATLTLSEALDASLSATASITPYLPGAQYVGSPGEARNAALSIGGTATKYRSFTFTLENNVEYIEDEVDATAEYPSEFVSRVRRTNGHVGILFRSDDVAYFAKGLANQVTTIAWTITGGAGSNVTLTLPQALLHVPTVAEAAPAINLEMDFSGRATSSGEDEASLAYS